MAASLTGAWLSMSMPETVAVALLSALSSAVPLALWPLPSSVRTTSPGHSAIVESASEHAKRTRTALLNQPSPFALRSAPASVIVLPLIDGAVRSMFTAVLDVGSDSLPALSLTVFGPDFKPLPSPPITLLAGTVAESIPDSASWPTQLIVTSPLYHPAALSTAVGVPASVGLVRSILIGPTTASLVLPALSSALPVTETPAVVVWADTVSLPRQPAMPDCRSLQSKLTSTGTLFQPNALASGVRLPVISGLMSSIFSVTEWSAASLFSMLPALSTLQNVIVCVPLRLWSNAPE